MIQRSLIPRLLLAAGLSLVGCAPGSSGPVSGPLPPTSIAPSELPDGSSPPTPSTLPEDPGLSDYLAAAALNNPGLRAAFYRWKAALDRAPQLRAMPDPRFTYRYFIEEVETRVGAQRQGVELGQTVPWFGKLGLRGDAAAEAANAERQRYEAAKLMLFYRVKDAYCEYYYLARAVDTIKENIQLLGHIESIARTRYKTAAASHPDVIRLQVELGKLDDRRRTLQELRGPLAAGLNAAMNLPVDTVLPWPEAVEDRGLAVTDDQLQAWLAESSPQLKALAHEIAQSRRQIELARKDYFPDVTVGLNYIQTAPSTHGRHPADDGKDPFVAMVSVNLPIWREKLDAGVREARHLYTAAIRRKQQQTNSLTAELKFVLYRYHDAERKIDLFRDTLLPKAKQGLKATQVAFQAGKASFTDLLDAQRVLLEFQLGHERARSSKAQRLAELEMLVGRKISRSGNEPAGKDVSIGGEKDLADAPAEKDT